MATRAVVPYASASCCAKRQFSTTFPSSLHGFLTPDEFSSSISRVNAANRVGAGPMFAWIGSWFLYGAGLSMIFNNYGDYYDSYANYYWTGFGTLIVSIICLVASGRWMRTRRADNLTSAVLSEHNTYSHRGLAYRIINAGTRSASIEIDVLGQQQQHFIAMPVHHHQHEHENVHHAHLASAPVQHQHVQHQVPQYQPYFSHPTPVHNVPQSPSPHYTPVSPHYTPVHPQYVHASPSSNPPHYAQAYPQVVEHRAPLMSHY